MMQPVKNYFLTTFVTDGWSLQVITLQGVIFLL